MATEETKIEEILTEAGSVGLRSRTIESAYNILQRNPDIDRVSAYNLAFTALLKNVSEPDNRDIQDFEYVDNEDDDIPIDEFLYDKFGDLEFDNSDDDD
jgi:hypothetical protein|tara:strand:+ start:121 stop:417 length:297 start_codon:yes stop_codon:yes gene_type:complete